MQWKIVYFFLHISFMCSAMKLPLLPSIRVTSKLLRRGFWGLSSTCSSGCAARRASRTALAFRPYTRQLLLGESMTDTQKESIQYSIKTNTSYPWHMVLCLCCILTSVQWPRSVLHLPPVHPCSLYPALPQALPLQAQPPYALPHDLHKVMYMEMVEYFSMASAFTSSPVHFAQTNQLHLIY